MAEDESSRRGCATANHMLVRSADVGRDDLEDHGMVDLATMGILKFWIGNVPNLDHAWLDIDDTAILAHRTAPDVGTIAIRSDTPRIAQQLTIRWLGGPTGSRLLQFTLDPPIPF
jgi:hypothetical protein